MIKIYFSFLFALGLHTGSQLPKPLGFPEQQMETSFVITFGLLSSVPKTASEP